MSHAAEIRTQLKNRAALEAACVALKLPAPQVGIGKFYDQVTAAGLVVQLPGWLYPVVAELDQQGQLTGTLTFDVYNGSWGDPAELARLKQEYGLQLTQAELAAQGYGLVSRTVLENGSIKLEMEALYT